VTVPEQSPTIETLGDDLLDRRRPSGSEPVFEVDEQRLTD
jgi:hypothetical protein